MNNFSVSFRLNETLLNETLLPNEAVLVHRRWVHLVFVGGVFKPMAVCQNWIGFVLGLLWVRLGSFLDRAK